MMKPMEALNMAGDAMAELREIRKQLSIRNVLDLANIRYEAYRDRKHLENGAEMSEKEYYELIEDLWDATVDHI